jgi:polyisoprenyl-teichoic acid--peptidoglycan teichoic acid transferase
MISRRRTLVPRALAMTLALLSLLILSRLASASPPASSIDTLPIRSTAAAHGAYAEEPGDIPRLPALFPARLATPTPSGPPSIHVTENILILGMDAREGGKMWRTDTIMIAAVDASRREVGILSIPRDLWVDIPGYGQGRINIVDFIGENRAGPGGGPGLMSKVLQDNLGIEAQHWVRIRQEGLVKLVDAMDGITITLDCPFVDKTPDPKVKGQYEYLMLPAGPVFLEGETAKKFVTYRYASTDFSRARRQQQIIWAIRARALELDLLPRIPQLWTSLAATFQTDLLVGDIVRLALLARDLAPEQVHGMVLSRKTLKSAAINGSAVLVIADQQAVKQEVDGLFASRPIAELGHSAMGPCGATASTMIP